MVTWPMTSRHIFACDPGLKGHSYMTPIRLCPNISKGSTVGYPSDSLASCYILLKCVVNAVVQGRRRVVTVTRPVVWQLVTCANRRRSGSVTRDWRQTAQPCAQCTAAQSRYRKWSTAHARDSCRLVPASLERCRYCSAVTMTCVTIAAMTSVSAYKCVAPMCRDDKPRPWQETDSCIVANSGALWWMKIKRRWWRVGDIQTDVASYRYRGRVLKQPSSH